MVDRRWDLIKNFLNHYFDPRMMGKTGLKDVYPILCPEVAGYGVLGVQGGTEASATFGKILGLEEGCEERETLRSDLLAYCELDTLAMVEILGRVRVGV